MLATAQTLSSGVLDGVAYRILGDGRPVTVFAHGLGGSTTEARPLARRVEGTRVLLDFRGHGDSAALEDGWDYDLLATDLMAIADATGATRAVGLSLGAGALLRLVESSPDRFQKLAFVLPAAIDGTRRDGATLRLEALGEAIDRCDARAAAAVLLADLPADVRSRRGVPALVLRRATQLVSRPTPAPRYDDRPLRDRRALSRITAPALVISQGADLLHPAALAAELAALLPAGHLMALQRGGVFWTQAEQAQTALAQHLLED